jgi:protein-disulfide isomerase
LFITRRQFVEGASALAILSLTAAAPAFAQAPSTEELMQPGPLGEQSQGPDDAPVTIIEYASMTCSHCASFHVNTYPLLKERYIDTGKVRYILREFPLDPLAAGAFMLARCAGEGKYFPLVDALFQQQRTWVTQKPIEPLLNIAKQAGFTQETFEQCLADQKTLDAIEAVRQRAAEKFGVNSTPTFFINGKIHRGALTIDELEKEIQPYLKS